MEEQNYWTSAMQRRVTRRTWLRGAGLISLGVAGSSILGCGGQQTTATATPSAATKGGTPIAGTATTGKATPRGKITIAAQTMGEMLMDQTWGKNGNLYPILYELHDYLVKRDADGKLKPYLASSYKISDDGLSWEFVLRKGIKFHNGDPITPEDFKYTYERNWRPRFQNPYLKTYEKLIDRVEAVGEDKVVFYTKGPQPMFLLQAPLYVVPKKYVEQVGDVEYEKKPVGSGPYKLVKAVIGEYVEYEAFEDYHDAVDYPKVKTIVIRVVPEGASRVAMLQTGDADAISAVTAPMAQQIKGISGARVIAAEKTGAVHLQFFKMYDPNSPFSKLKVRQALSHAIDREAIASKIYNGEAFPLAVGGVSALAFGVDPAIKAHAYDPEKAKKLLAEAGYPNGFEAEITTYDTAAMAGMPDQMQAVAGFFDKIGVKTKVTLMETGTYTAKYRDKTVPGDMGPITMPTTGGWDLAYTLNTFYTSIAPYSHIKEPEIDKLWEESMQVVDSAKREAVLQKAYRLIYDHVLGLGTIEANALFGAGPKVKDWKVQKGVPYLNSLERIVPKD